MGSVPDPALLAEIGHGVAVAVAGDGSVPRITDASLQVAGGSTAFRRGGDTSVPIQPQGEPPTAAATAAWNFNLSTPDARLALPPVPADWEIVEPLPRPELTVPVPMPEEMQIRACIKCIKNHRVADPASSSTHMVG